MAARVPKVVLFEEPGDIYLLNLKYDADELTANDCQITLIGPGAFATAHVLKDYFEQHPEAATAIRLADSLERLALQTEEILETTRALSSKRHLRSVR